MFERLKGKPSIKDRPSFAELKYRYIIALRSAKSPELDTLHYELGDGDQLAVMDLSEGLRDAADLLARGGQVAMLTSSDEASEIMERIIPNLAWVFPGSPVCPMAIDHVYVFTQSFLHHEEWRSWPLEGTTEERRAAVKRRLLITAAHMAQKSLTFLV